MWAVAYVSFQCYAIFLSFSRDRDMNGKKVISWELLAVNKVQSALGYILWLNWSNKAASAYRHFSGIKRSVYIIAPAE